MDAYIIDYLQDKNNKYIRILDLSPTATVKVYNYQYEAVYSAIKNNKLAINDVEIIDKHICYCKYDISKAFKNVQNKLFFIRFKQAYGKMYVMGSDYNGNIKVIDINKLNETNIGIFSNIKLLRVKDDETNVFLNGNSIKIVKLDSSNFDIEGSLDWIKKESLNESTDYSIENDTLYKYTGKSENLVIPNGVNTISGITSESNNIKKIFIPESVDCIGEGVFDEIDVDVEIKYEPKEYRFDIAIGLNRFSCKKLTNILPEHLRKLRKFDNFIFNDNKQSFDGDLSKFSNLGFICYCFYNMNINDFALGKSIYNISSCYVECTFNELKVLAMPSNLTECNNSFTGMKGVEVLKFEKGSKLKYISYSFTDCKDLKIVDLSNCNELQTIGSSFYDCPKLETVILPEGLTKISQSFNDCIVHDCILPDSLERISDLCFCNCKQTDWIIPSNCTKAKGLDRSEITIGFKNVKSIKLDLTCMQYCNINIPESVEYIDTGVEYGNWNKLNFENKSGIKFDFCRKMFKCSYGDIMDISDWDINTINKDDIEHIRIGTMILPRKLKAMGDNFFSLIIELDSVLIPDELDECSSSVFRGLNKNGKLIKYYVVNGSKAHEVLKKIKLMTIVCNSYDEAYNILTSDKSTTQQQLKAKLIFNNDQDPIIQEMISDTYKKDSIQLTKLYNTLKANSSDKVELDISNLINKKAYVAEIIDKINDAEKLQNICNWLNKFTKYCDYNSIDNRFKALLNFISNTFESNKTFLNADAFAKLLNEADVNGKSVMSRYYDEDNFGILNFWIKRDKALSNDIQILAVFIGNSLVFVTCFVENDRTKFHIDNVIQNVFMNKIKSDEYNISSILDTGDKIKFGESETSIIKNIAISTKFERLIEYLVCNQLIIIWNDYNSFKPGFKAILMSTVDGSIFIIKYVTNAQKIHTVDDFKNLVIFNKCNFNNIGDEYKQLIYDSTLMYNHKVNQLAIQRALNNEVISKLLKLDGAYDDVQPCFEWELSKLLNKNSIYCVQNLSFEQLECLLNTAFFKRTNKRDLDTYCENVTQLKDGTEIKEYGFMRSSESLRTSLYCDLINTEYDNRLLSVNDTLFMASGSLKDMFCWVFNIYADGHNHVSMDNRFHELSEFSIISKIEEMYIAGVLMLGISKADGIAYLLGAISAYDNDILILAEYKSLKDGIKNFNKMKAKKGWSYTDYKKFGESIGEVDQLRKYILKRCGSDVVGSGQAEEFVNKQIQGYPNGYVIGGALTDTFDIVAKHKPKQ